MPVQGCGSALAWEVCIYRSLRLQARTLSLASFGELRSFEHAQPDSLDMDLAQRMVACWTGPADKQFICCHEVQCHQRAPDKGLSAAGAEGFARGRLR